jgi:hypothetical protein
VDVTLAPEKIETQPGAPEGYDRAWVWWLGLAVVVAGAVIGYVIWQDGGTAIPETEDFVIADPVAELSLQVDAGNIQVIGTDETEVSVERTVRPGVSGDEPVLSEELVGERLTIISDCDGDRNCSVDHDIRIPMGTDLTIEAAAGDLYVDSISGSVQVDSAAGNVRLRELAGDLDLTATAGQVTGVALESTDVRLVATAGNVELEFVVPMEDLSVTAAAGSVTIDVVGGPYDVTAETAVGNATIDVATDPDAAAKITVSVAAGNVTIRGS